MASSSDDGPPSSPFEAQLKALPPLRRVTPPPSDEEPASWSSSFHPRSHSTTPRSRPASPVAFAAASSSSSSPFRASRLSSSGGFYGPTWWMRVVSCLGFSLGDEEAAERRLSQKQWLSRKKKVGGGGGGARGWRRRRKKEIAAWIGVVTFFFLMNWWFFSRLPLEHSIRRGKSGFSNSTSSSSSMPATRNKRHGKVKSPHGVMFSKLLGLAAHALAEAEGKPEPKDLWQEPLDPAVSWTPCADQRSWETCEGNNGYILVSATGGINQQRVAICNAVAVARLLNSTLVIPHFSYNNVWRDKSQFSDIYHEEHFIDYLKADIRIVKELPVELRSLDLEAIGSLVTDDEVMKESKPSFYLKKILPILIKNSVVHFVGFGNRLAFDPIPFELQRLRCRCNFHALRFVDKIQETGALLVQRMRKQRSHSAPLEHNLLGAFAGRPDMTGLKNLPSQYLAVHLRFEIDMAAYSLCYFGGGKDEIEELEAYRAAHFPALTLLRKTKKIPSASLLRSEGQCPLTPEEAVLMLAALGFKRRTNIYVAGAQIYGGKSRMASMTSLYPNLVTKETLLSSSEIEPFRNFSSQLAALDFIVCAAADAFAMTDSGSQLSSLVSGYRMYYGDGRLPTIRPNKRRLASIFSKNSTIEWKEFEHRVRKAIRQTKQVFERPFARSMYRHPRCPECMCKIE
ncbi:O-fucosyltransferase 2 [Cocos nucifera]|uniref:O-fucosyltransferase family protein n=1 Tax=Cocos nucifera TaxID=13894 RepID=A0A8K0MUP8_COCNU|nr:O-fucosyltransferase 2 [Cocos nucifera]